MPAGILGQPRSALLIPGAPPEPVTVSDTGCSVTPAPLTLTVTSQRTVIGVAAIAPATLVLSAASQATVTGVVTVTAAAVIVTATSQRTVIGTASLSAATLVLSAKTARAVISSGVPGLPPGLIVPGVPPQPIAPVSNLTALQLGDLVLSVASQRDTAASAVTLPLDPVLLSASGVIPAPVLIVLGGVSLGVQVSGTTQRDVLGVATILLPDANDTGLILSAITYVPMRREGYASAAAASG